MNAVGALCKPLAALGGKIIQHLFFNIKKQKPYQVRSKTATPKIYIEKHILKIASMTRLLKNIPETVRPHIREYTSDKVGTHPTAPLIKSLIFRQSQPHQFFSDGYDSTIVVANDPAYFIQRWQAFYTHHSDYIRFCHNQFDERNFPQHFDISLNWDNLREQDEIEAMVAGDVQIYREGLPSEVPYNTYITHALQWSRTDTGRWIANPPP